MLQAAPHVRDICAMVWIARVSGVLAAFVWLIGAPIVALAGVPLPSDAEYSWEGIVSVALGLTLAPLTALIGPGRSSSVKILVRLAGMLAAIALVASGALLLLAVDGRLGYPAPRSVVDSPVVAALALFLWAGVASILLRGPSTTQRAIFGIGLLASGSTLVTAITAGAIFYFAPNVVWTNVTVLPIFLVDLLLWLTLPAWLLLVVATL